MALHRRRPGETVAAERARLHRKDTVAGRATKRQNTRRRGSLNLKQNIPTKKRR